MTDGDPRTLPLRLLPLGPDRVYGRLARRQPIMYMARMRRSFKR